MLAIACASAPPAANEPFVEVSVPIAEAQATEKNPVTAIVSEAGEVTEAPYEPPLPNPGTEIASTEILPSDAPSSEAFLEPEPAFPERTEEKEPDLEVPPIIEESLVEEPPELEPLLKSEDTPSIEPLQEPAPPDASEPPAAPAEPAIPQETKEASTTTILEGESSTSIAVLEPPLEILDEAQPSSSSIPDVVVPSDTPATPEPELEPAHETIETLQKEIEKVAPVPFDPKRVSDELKSATILDVRTFVDTLNSIIRTRNFESWKRNLTKEYIDYYSNSLILATLSESSVLQRMTITLRSLYDYFIYVVYPSRQNVKVDDIEFTSEDRIVVISLNSKGERLVLYELEKNGDSWAIGTGR
ncbi:MAG: hypothetical protein Q8N15_02995 [Bacillota bacterium]|nr:hypothetical protein [Bacillota bacterium]